MHRCLRWLLAGLLFKLLVARARRRFSPDFDPNDPDNWIGLDYVHEQVMTQLTRQQARWEEVDGRLRLVLGVIGIVFAAAAGFVRSSQPAGSDPLATALPFPTGALVAVSLTLYLFAGGIAFWAHRPQNFDRPPVPVQMRADYVATDPREAKVEVVDFVLVAYDKNEKVIARKLRWFNAAYWTAAGATAAMGVALIGQIVAQTKAWGV